MKTGRENAQREGDIFIYMPAPGQATGARIIGEMSKI